MCVTTLKGNRCDHFKYWKIALIVIVDVAPSMCEAERDCPHNCFSLKRGLTLLTRPAEAWKPTVCWLLPESQLFSQLSIVAIAFHIFRTIEVNRLMGQLLRNPGIYADFEFLAFWQTQYNNMNAVNLFFAWIKVSCWVTRSTSLFFKLPMVLVTSSGLRAFLQLREQLCRHFLVGMPGITATLWSHHSV